MGKNKRIKAIIGELENYQRNPYSTQWVKKYGEVVVWLRELLKLRKVEAMRYRAAEVGLFSSSVEVTSGQE